MTKKQKVTNVSKEICIVTGYALMRHTATMVLMAGIAIAISAFVLKGDPE